MSNDSVKDVSEVVQALMTNVVSELTGHDRTREGRERDTEPPEPRLFFPSGIELIDVTVTVGGVDVHVKVAGGKGLSASRMREVRRATRSFGDECFVEVTNPPLETDVHRRDLIVWENHDTLPHTVSFKVPCLNVNNFPVPPNGGQVLTYVVTTVNDGDYYYTCGATGRRHPTQGNPKIVIQ